MKLPLSPIQKTYKQASDIYEEMENSMITLAEDIAKQIHKMIESKESYAPLIRQEEIDTGAEFFKNYIQFTAKDGESVEHYFLYCDFIKFCFLAADKKPGESSPHLSSIQMHDSYIHMTHNAKSQLVTLLALWEDIYESTCMKSILSKVQQTAALDLPRRLEIYSTKREKGKSLPDHLWLPLVKSA